MVRVCWRHTSALIGALVISVLLAGCLGQYRPIPGRPAAAVDISGVVRSLETGTPVAGATVTINNRTATTQPDGTYSIPSVSVAGRRLEFRASAPGHLSRTGSAPARGGVALRLDFDLPFATIPGSGKVTGRLNFAVPDFSWGDAAGDCLSPYGQLTNLVSQARSPRSQAVRPEAHPITSGEVVIELWGRPTHEVAQRIAGNVAAKSFRISDLINRIILDAPDPSDIEGFILRVKAEPEVIDAYPNEILVMPMGFSSPYAATPNDSCYDVLHHLHQINAPLAWNATTGDPSVVVAVVDTGISTDHPDLASNVISGRNFVSAACLGQEDVVLGSDEMLDCSGHGTMVSGVIGAVGNNDVGVTGVAWNVSLLPIRVARFISATIETVAEGFRFAVDSGADIVNFSLFISEDYPPIRETIEDAVAQGIIVVTVAGNSGPHYDPPGYPALYDGVIGVGAVQRASPTTIWEHSSRGPGVDLVAPGEWIWSTSSNSGYSYDMGTSLAAPIVSGVAALMLANGIPPNEVGDILRRTAVRIGNPDHNQTDLHTYGYGLVNAYGAVMGVDPADAILLAINGDGRIVGSITSPDSQRRYEIDDVPGGNPLYLAGWIDVNGSETLDMGDYFGLKEFSVAEDGRITVDLDLDVYDRLEEIELGSKWVVDLDVLRGL